MNPQPEDRTMKTLLAAAAALIPTLTRAHEGHGMPGASHWHATDAVGLLVVVALAAGAWWWIRRK
jgi:hypothetical protein